MARDYFGKELRVGDTVVYICEIQTSVNFEEGTIEKVTAKQVKINGTRHAGHKCIKISKRRKHYGNTDENTDEGTN